MRGNSINKGRAVFLDRDGTLIAERRYLNQIDQIEVLPGALEAVRRLNQAGLLAIVATNQSALARGLLTHERLERIHYELARRFRAGGARLDAFYHCPHHPDFASGAGLGECNCRKPNPGMLLKAAKEFNLDLSRSFAVGDRMRDVEAGRRAGCRSVLVKTGYGAEEVQALSRDPSGWSLPDHIAPDLLAAVDWILERCRG